MNKKEQLVRSEAEIREIRRNKLYNLLPFASLLLLIVLWTWVSAGEDATFPSPNDIWMRLLKFIEKPIMRISLVGHIWASLQRVFIALIAAWIIGISFGVLLGWSSKANALFGPLFTGFRAVPPLAWIPLITIWFGTGEFPKILVVFIGAIMPIVVNTQVGIKNVDKLYLDVGSIFHANKKQQLLQIAVPSALDAVFAGIRTSTSAAWMVVLAAEMLGGKSGVGFLIVRGMDAYDMALVLLSMICIGLVGAALAILTQMIERMVCPWKAPMSN